LQIIIVHKAAVPSLKELSVEVLEEAFETGKVENILLHAIQVRQMTLVVKTLVVNTLVVKRLVVKTLGEHPVACHPGACAYMCGDVCAYMCPYVCPCMRL